MTWGLTAFASVIIQPIQTVEEPVFQPLLQSGAVYKIINAKSNKTLAVNGDNAIQYSNSQHWKLNIERKDANSDYTVFSLISMSNNKALSIPVDKIFEDTATNVNTAAYDGASQQMFTINYERDGKYSIKTLNGNAIDVEGGNTSDGANIIKYPYHGGDNQLWRIERVNNSVTHTELAQYWSPMVYQDVYNWSQYFGDFISKFDYDGDWKGNNNWNNLEQYKNNLKAYSYYSVQETATHYYIGYNFYHPRDDAPYGLTQYYDNRLPLDCHENDMEGIIVVVTKNGYGYGDFLLMETVSHGHRYQYTNDSSITGGYENIEGGVRFTETTANGVTTGKHPWIKSTSNGVGNGHGHGITAITTPHTDGGILYYTTPANVAERSHFDRNRNDNNYNTRVQYGLISLDELWSRRNDIGNGRTFGKFGDFDGDDYRADAASAPWGWNDGLWLSDPAYLIDSHLNGLQNFSHNYIFNKYFTLKIKLEKVTSKTNKDPGLLSSKRADIYLKTTVGGKRYTDYKTWKWDNISVGHQVDYIFGGRRGVDRDTLRFYDNDNFNAIYIARPEDSEVKIEALDSDNSSIGDDHDTMGSITVRPSTSQVAPYTYINGNTSNNEAHIKATINIRY